MIGLYLELTIQSLNICDLHQLFFPKDIFVQNTLTCRIFLIFAFKNQPKMDMNI